MRNVNILMVLPMCFVVGCSNGISYWEVKTGSERIRELREKAFEKEQSCLEKWEFAETNEIVTLHNDLLQKEQLRFKVTMLRECGFDSEFTTMENYRLAFNKYVEQKNVEFTEYMKNHRMYVIGEDAEEWPNLGTGGRVTLLVTKEEDGTWVLSYAAKGVKNGKKISVAVYDHNGLFIERCAFTVDGKWTREYRDKTESRYDYDMTQAQMKSAQATVSYLNTPNPTLGDAVAFSLASQAPLYVSKTTSEAKWVTQDVTGKIVLTLTTNNGRIPTYYAVRVSDPDLSHKMKKGFEWVTEGGVF